ncbi:DUF4822 domain-containing protein [Proteus mirabilis]|uniref:DUF4822 domain-containing protein n=2 Tax=Proteus mirabilis TaxID=584 RepID=UPI001E287855|nr:DUF4822 domain-containing protein [Proteus mirabilis]MCD4610440.1 DUF4822 domain-containing protein [Proteus mirabilis]
MKAERHKKIVNLIKGHGAVKVSVLAKELSVTKETIRSDLNTLAEKGNKVDANNPQVSNYFGLAEYYPNGTFIMFTPEGKQKMQGDWSMSNDGKTRTLVAKDAQGKTLFTRDVENITINNDEYTYRIYPTEGDNTVYFDIIHHVKK